MLIYVEYKSDNIQEINYTNEFIEMKYIKLISVHLVSPHKSTGIAKGSWPFRSTTHHWGTLLADATMTTADSITSQLHKEDKTEKSRRKERCYFCANLHYLT